ncbi:Mipc synthase [Ophiocordyceps camponoti-floridani]|uniref:Mipc synthase n=1 Tax=Ophiocordyceps camponoti-floridani TaxID=2030778 RepID=A0A8H4Q2A2_9HYPO|nr:Mipc synthase [Ophiocordyceps camponoti-floridani]
MASLMRWSSRKVGALVFLALLFLLVVHQVSYISDIDFANRLPDPLQVVSQCSAESQHDNTGIPKRIHQMWKTNNVSSYPIEATHTAWKSMFEPADYTVKLWAEADIVNLIAAKYPWLLSTYQGYSQNIQRADVARLVVLHAEGGIYADLDVHPVSLQEISCWRHLGLQALFAPTSGTQGISNHFVMAEKGSAFLQWALHEAKRRGGASSRRIIFPYLQVFWSTGPLMVNSAYRSYVSHMGQADKPVGVAEERYGGSVIRHAAGRSWHKSDGLFLNYVADRVGVGSSYIVIVAPMLFLALAAFLARRHFKAGMLASRDGPLSPIIERIQAFKDRS